MRSDNVQSRIQRCASCNNQSNFYDQSVDHCRVQYTQPLGPITRCQVTTTHPVRLLELCPSALLRLVVLLRKAAYHGLYVFLFKVALKGDQSKFHDSTRHNQ